MNSSDHDGALTVAAFCEWANIGRTAVYEEIASGRLDAKKRGKRTLIPRSSARAWLENLPPVPTRPSGKREGV
jgi:excisionase family DNA binding protein